MSPPVSPENQEDAEPTPALDLHGLSHLSKTNRAASRACWAIILSLFFFALCLGVYNCAMDYWYNPILTTVNLVPCSKMKFPQVYICPSNFINQSFVQSKNVNLKYAHAFRSSVQNVSGNDILQEKTTIWEDLAPDFNPDMHPNDSAEPIDFQEHILSLGYDAARFVRECRFHNDYLDCLNITSEIFDRDYGKCFLIDVNDTQKTAGLGLSLVLDIHTQEYPTDSPPIFDGVSIIIDHDHSPARFERILASPGQLTRLGLETHRVELVNVEGRGVTQRCLTAAEGRSFMQILANTPYSSTACQADCSLRVVLHACDCIMPLDRRYLNAALNSTFCTPDQMHECVFPTLVEANSHNVTACVKNCYPACESWHFRAQISHSIFPSWAIKSKWSVLGEEKVEKWMRDYVLLDIAFSELQFFHIVQTQSMTLDTFVSNLGGQMGIWLGASLLTIVQALTLFSSYCCAKLTGGY